MGFYEHTVFNFAMEQVLTRPAVHAQREAALAHVQGRILEIGLGTGLNLPAYPAEIRSVTTVSLDERLDRRAEARARTLGIEVEPVVASAEAMPIDDGAFDTVVTTFVLCTVDEPRRTLAEIRRVLAPGGRLVFLEHVPSTRPMVRRLQRVLDPLHRAVVCGCSMVRDTTRIISEAGFEQNELIEQHLPGVLWPYRHVVRGVSTLM